MQHFEPLVEGEYYHIYNRGINGENIFREEKNYAYFLNLYAKYIEPVADTFAYCLLKNHFHLLIRIKEVALQTPSGAPSPDGVIKKNASKQFGHLFNAYAQGFNKTYQRTGGLFVSPFKRKRVDNDNYFTSLIWYIHANAERHKLIVDFREWPYSSYHSLLAQQPTKLKREEVINWFGNKEHFKKFHSLQQKDLKDLIIELD